VTPEDVKRLLPLAAGAIGPLASAQTVLAVAAHNPDCIWMIQGEAGRPHGFQAWLLLNEAGRKALLDGKMDLSSPELGHISEPGEKPSLLYIWATYAPGKTACGVERIHEHFSSPFYADVDMVSWAAGTRGERALARHGFVKGVQTGNRRIEHLWMLARSPASIRQRLPLYDTYLPGTGLGGIRMARLHDIEKVTAIRAAVFIAEQACPHEEEFDGNDLGADHLLLYVPEEPVGCIRVRSIGSFAKLERLAVRKEYRTYGRGRSLVKAAVAFCRNKGHTRLYGHARLDLLPYWKRFPGFGIKLEAKPFIMSDHIYIKMVADVPLSPDAITINSGPHIINRPNGAWHKEGALERSLTRGAR
jgi:predicted GNAT family N-acyltransferase